MANKSSSKKNIKKTSKPQREVSRGRVYIYSTYNNTIITVTDLQGNVLCSSSAGKIGFSGPKKATPYAASLVAKDVMDKAKNFGLKEIQIFVKGIGTGRDAAIRAVAELGFNVLSIKDITPIPHNGCRPPKVRRV